MNIRQFPYRFNTILFVKMSDITLGSSDNNSNKIPDFFHYIYSNQLNELICIKVNIFKLSVIIIVL